uniref:Uncharacterized protein n=1 Tax=Aegilops tauschii subsp. strangulata TaxID=200361 RepID=A0A453C201_AEGTS
IKSNIRAVCRESKSISSTVSSPPSRTGAFLSSSRPSPCPRAAAVPSLSITTDASAPLSPNPLSVSPPSPLPFYLIPSMLALVPIRNFGHCFLRYEDFVIPPIARAV